MSALSQPPPRSWKLGCKTSSDSEWVYNALRFTTKEECEAYGRHLFGRWTALWSYEAHPSEDPVSAAYRLTAEPME